MSLAEVSIAVPVMSGSCCHTGASVSRHILQQLDDDVALGLLGRLRDAAYLLLRRPSIQILARDSSYARRALGKQR